MKSKSFRDEISVMVNGRAEWWTVGLDVNDGHAEAFIAYGGIQQTDAPLAVMMAAVQKWYHWLEKTDLELFVASRPES